MKAAILMMSSVSEQKGFFIIESMLALVCFMCVIGFIAAGHAFFIMHQRDALKRLQAITLASSFIEEMIAGKDLEHAKYSKDNISLEYQLSSDDRFKIPDQWGQSGRKIQRLDVVVSWSSSLAQKESVRLITFFEST